MTGDQNIDDLAWAAARARLHARVGTALPVEDAYPLDELFDLWYQFRWTARHVVDEFLRVLSPHAMTRYEAAAVLAFAPACAGRDTFYLRVLDAGFRL